jgi:ATP-dependent protease ClpP protease subunit
MWELKQAANGNDIEMYIYGDVEGDYFDWWEWEMKESETSANHFRSELAKFPNAQNINIFINSYGGSVFEGTAIYSQLKRHPAQKTVYIDGFACSIASVIAMAADKIIMPKNAMMMIHNMWNVVAGNSTQLRKAADDLDTIMSGNRQAYMVKSNGKLTEEKLIQMLDAETWLTAEQCIEYGLADEYAEKEADLANAQQLLQKANLTMTQQIQFNKNFAAALKDMTTLPKQNTDTVPEPPKEQKLKLFAAFAAKKEV